MTRKSNLAAKLAATAEYRRLILAALEDLGGAATPEEISSRIGLSKSRANYLIRELKRTHGLRNSGRGIAALWVLPTCQLSPREMRLEIAGRRGVAFGWDPQNHFKHLVVPAALARKISPAGPRSVWDLAKGVA